MVDAFFPVGLLSEFMRLLLY